MKLAQLLLMPLMAFSTLAIAVEIIVGDIYPVKERSMSEIIADAVNSPALKQKLATYTKSFESGFQVSDAVIDKQYNYIPWYTLTEPFKDHTGQMLFPAGFRFNPLMKIRAPGRLVFFGEHQLQWVQANRQEGDFFILTTGDINKAGIFLSTQVFLLDSQTQKRLAVKAIPSTYFQGEGAEHFTVNHYAL